MRQLTEREYDILRALMNGWSQQEIALSLEISKNTVKGYTQRIYQYLGINRREQLEPLIAMAKGFVMPEKAKGMGA